MRTLVMLAFLGLCSCATLRPAEDKRPFCEKKYGEEFIGIDWGQKYGSTDAGLASSYNGFYCVYSPARKPSSSLPDQCTFDPESSNYKCKSPLFRVALLCKNQELLRYWDPSMYMDACRFIKP